MLNSLNIKKKIVYDITLNLGHFFALVFVVINFIL